MSPTPSDKSPPLPPTEPVQFLCAIHRLIQLNREEGEALAHLWKTYNDLTGHFRKILKETHDARRDELS
jgi:hypothetical protein